jgi:putative ABC transport system permease protein
VHSSRGYPVDEGRAVTGAVEAGTSRADGRARRVARLRNGLLTYSGDVAYAARSLRRSPAFTVIAAVTLAVGIGAVSASVGLVSQVLLRPLAGVTASQELVLVAFEREPGRATGVSYPNLSDLRDAASPIADLVGYSPVALHLAPQGGAAVRLEGAMVVGDYFHLLGVRAHRGRLFAPEELRPDGASFVAVVSHALWRSSFGAAQDVIGRSIELNGTLFTIVGVAPPGFHGTERLEPVDVWVPAPTYARLRHATGLALSDRRPGVIQALIGRLRPGATPGALEAGLRLTMRDLAARYPEANEIYRTFLPTVYTEIDLPPNLRARIASLARLLLGVASLVLLVACGNVANLLLLRRVRRRDESAVRYALGATPRRLFSLALAESCLLAGLGGAGGLLVAYWLTASFRGTRVFELPPVARLSLDAPTLLVASSLAFLVAILCGIVSFGVVSRERLAGRLRAAAPHQTRGVSRAFRLLVAAQIAATCVLAVAALLFGRTLHNLSRVELGFRPRGVAVYGVDPAVQGYSKPHTRLLKTTMLENVRSLPGVQSATLAASTPFSDVYFDLRVRGDGSGTDGPPALPLGFFVQPDYFETLGIPILAGRDFLASETAEPAGDEGDVVILSESLARELFGERNPIGLQVEEEDGDRIRLYSVIGIVGDVRATQLGGQREAAMYRPLSASWGSDGSTWARS